MRLRHLAILFAVLAAAFLPGTAHAQCWYFSCDSYGAYDPNSNEISGYSRTVDWLWGYVWIGVDSSLQDPNGWTVNSWSDDGVAPL